MQHLVIWRVCFTMSFTSSSIAASQEHDCEYMKARFYTMWPANETFSEIGDSRDDYINLNNLKRNLEKIHSWTGFKTTTLRFPVKCNRLTGVTTEHPVFGHLEFKLNLRLIIVTKRFIPRVSPASSLVIECGSNFWVCGWNPTSVTIQMKAIEQYLPMMLLLCCTRWF